MKGQFNLSLKKLPSKSPALLGLIDPKPLHIKLNKIDGFIRIYDRTTYLTLFSSEKHDAIYDRIR